LVRNMFFGTNTVTFTFIRHLFFLFGAFLLCHVSLLLL